MARRTKEEAEETRQKLLDAAELVFRSQGVSSSTLDQIALKAGTSRGAIQWHFKDKSGLMDAMLSRISFPIRALVASRVDENPTLPLTTVVAGILEPMKILATDEQARNVVAIAAHMMEFTPELAAYRSSTLNTQENTTLQFKVALKAGARYHGIKLQGDAALAARGLCAVLYGLIETWVLDPDAFDLPRAARVALQIQLRGLGFDETILRQYGLAARVGKPATRR